MKFIYWYEGLIFILIFSTIVLTPCWAVAYLGTKLINDLGQYPTKSPKIHMGICVPIIVIMIVSFFFLGSFFFYFQD